MSNATSLPAVSGVRRAAVLILQLGDEAAASVLAQLPAREAEAVAAEVARLDGIDPAEAHAVMAEYLERMGGEAGELLSRGGPERLARLLSGRGEDGRRILDRVVRTLGTDRLAEVSELDPRALAALLAAEPPQAIALLLSRLEPRQAARILAALAPEVRQVTAARLARTGGASLEALEELLHGLRLKLGDLGHRLAAGDGVKSLAGILHHLGAELGGELLDGIESEDPELAARVRDLAVVFDDLLLIDDRAMPTLVQRIDKRVLARALKGTREELKAKCFRGMSERAGTLLREEMDLLGPIRLTDAQTARIQVVAILKKLIEEGAITLHEPGDGLVA